MFDALNSIDPQALAYHTMAPSPDASIDAAVATAAHRTLAAMYGLQVDWLDAAYTIYLAGIPNGAAKQQGIDLGELVAEEIFLLRTNDGSEIGIPYLPSAQPGIHDVDPLNPGQGFLTPGWGAVTPFGLDGDFDLAAPPPPALGSRAYAEAFNDVKSLGGDGVVTRTRRTKKQTEIGLYWAYDGAPGVGVPPRLYNQIARTIAQKTHNSVAENARLFALVNVAMADAGIVCWRTKYTYNVWRPILGIRRADEDGNPRTQRDANWTPLGAPASNQGGNNFTPSFPAYGSGHATFGAALFRTLERFYGTDRVPFTFVSDELNGVTTDFEGNVRPYRPRSFHSLREAALENARSRVYLGIHWQFDADEGVAKGYAIGDYVFDNVLTPLP